MEIAATFALFALGIFLLVAAWPAHKASARWIDSWLRRADELHQSHLEAYDAYRRTLSIEQAINELMEDARRAPRPTRRIRQLNRHYAKSPGFVYLLCVNGEYYKIGLSQNVKARLIDLQIATPYKIDLVHIVATDHAARLEVLLQGRYADKWVVGEWYRLSTDDVLFIRSITDFVTIADIDRMEKEIV